MVKVVATLVLTICLLGLIGLSLVFNDRPRAVRADRSPSPELRVSAQATVPAQKPATSAAQLLQISHVADVHLTFTADAWRTLTPVPSDTSNSRSDGFLGPEGKRNGISAMNGLDFEYVHAAMELDGKRFADVGVRYKGNGTYRTGRQASKVSLKVDLNKYVKGQKFDGLSTINLHNTITDASWMNEALAYRLYRDAGVPAPRTGYARVFVTVPGKYTRQYLGLYTLVENVDAHFAADRFHAEGGAIFKPVTEQPFDDLGSSWARYNQTYDPKTDLTLGDQQRIIDFCKLVTHASDADFTARIGEFLDIPAFATYAAVLVWLQNPDSILQQGQNYYVYLHPSTRRLAFIPWDQDHSFGSFPFPVGNASDFFHPWVQNIRFLQRIFRVDAFKTAYIAELKRLSESVFRPSRFAEQVDQLAPMLRPLVAEDPLRERLALFDLAVSGRVFNRPLYGGRTTPIKPFAEQRTADLLAVLPTAR